MDGTSVDVRSLAACLRGERRSTIDQSKRECRLFSRPIQVAAALSWVTRSILELSWIAPTLSFRGASSLRANPKSITPTVRTDSGPAR